jgi:hypothetical protein
MTKDQSDWSRKNFRSIAVVLALIGVFVTFGGIAVLAITIMQVQMFSWTPFGGGGIDFMTMGMSFMLTPMVKVIGMFLGFFGMGTVNTNNKVSGVLLVIAGIVTIPPIVIGGQQILDLIIQQFGWLPFVPHFISGAIFLAAGAFAYTSLPPDRPSYTVSAIVDPMPVPEATVCPNCRTPLIGDETYCPGCAKRLRR